MPFRPSAGGGCIPFIPPRSATGSSSTSYMSVLMKTYKPSKLG